MRTTEKKVRMPEETRQLMGNMGDFLKSTKNVDLLRLKIREMQKRDAIIKAMEDN